MRRALVGIWAVLGACSLAPTGGPSAPAVIEFRLTGENPGFPVVVERLAGTQHEQLGAVGGEFDPTLRVSVEPGRHQFFISMASGVEDGIAVEDSMVVVEVAAATGRVAHVLVSVRERTRIRWEGESRTYEGVRRKLDVRVEDELSRSDTLDCSES